MASTQPKTAVAVTVVGPRKPCSATADLDSERLGQSAFASSRTSSLACAANKLQFKLLSAQGSIEDLDNTEQSQVPDLQMLAANKPAPAAHKLTARKHIKLSRLVDKQCTDGQQAAPALKHALQAASALKHAPKQATDKSRRVVTRGHCPATGQQAPAAVNLQQAASAADTGKQATADASAKQATNKCRSLAEEQRAARAHQAVEVNTAQQIAVTAAAANGEKQIAPSVAAVSAQQAASSAVVERQAEPAADVAAKPAPNKRRKLNTVPVAPIEVAEVELGKEYCYSPGEQSDALTVKLCASSHVEATLLLSISGVSSSCMQFADHQSFCCACLPLPSSDCCTQHWY